METPLDLYRASRDELITVILRQREQIADLEQEVGCPRAELATQRVEVARLTERVGALLTALEGPEGDDPATRPTAMPGLKPATKRRAPAVVPSARKRRAYGYGRPRMRPTARQVHAYAQCPHCHAGLRGAPSNAPAR